MKRQVIFFFAISLFAFSSYFFNDEAVFATTDFDPSANYSVRSQAQHEETIRFLDNDESVLNIAIENVRNAQKILTNRSILSRIFSMMSFEQQNNNGDSFGYRVMNQVETWKNVVPTILNALSYLLTAQLQIFTLPQALFVSTNPPVISEYFMNTVQPKKDGCNGSHNSEKSYTVSDAARLLSGMLKVGPDRLLSQFRCDDPQDLYIPQKAKEVYRQSFTWWPRQSFFTKKVTNDYLQCVTFVFMSYQMADHPIEKKGRTNAADFLAEKYTGKKGQFNKYRSGEATVLPQEGDIAIWSSQRTGTITGHAGVVIEVRENIYETEHSKERRFGTIRIANSNSTRSIHEYRYVQDEKTKIVRIEKVTQDWVLAPDYWLRMK